MDYLSFCPVLVDILQMLDVTDIPICKLVNRRIGDVIQKNALSMPRVCHDMLLILVQKENTPFRYVDVNLRLGSDLRVLITEARTMLLECKPSTLDYYRKYGTQFNNNAVSPDEAVVEKIRENCIFYERAMADCVTYQNDSLEDGLRTLLSFLFKRYHYNHIQLRYAPEAWLPMLIDELRRNRPRCESLFIPEMTPGILLQVAEKLGCNELLMPIQQISESVILDVVNLNRPIRLRLCGPNIVSDTQNLLELLLSGPLMLGKVVLHSRSFLTSITDYSMNGNSGPATKQIVKQLTEDIQDNWDELNDKWKHFSKTIDTVRSCDNAALCITYSNSITHPSDIDVYIKQL